MNLDIINKYWNFSNNPNYWFIPLIWIIIVLAISVFIGYKKGFIKSLFNLALIIISTLLASLIALPILGAIQANSTSWLERLFNLQIETINKQIDIIKPLIAGVLILVIFFILYSVLSLILFIIFKLTKILTLGIFNRNHKSVLSRSLGATIGVVNAIIPIALTTNLSATINYNNAVVKANNSLLNVVTFGQAKGISEYAPGGNALSNIIADDDIRKGFNDFFSSLTSEKNITYNNKLINSSNLNTVIGAEPEIIFGINPWTGNTTKERVERISKVIEQLRLFSLTNESTDLFRLMIYSTNSAVDKDKVKEYVANVARIFSIAHIDLSQITFAYDYASSNSKLNNNIPVMSLWMFNDQEKKNIKETFLDAFGYKGVKVPSKEEGNISSKSDEEKYMYVLNEIINNVFFAPNIK
ncbi:hypothetical protein MM26B8_00350 [Mycoplasmopsis meleagridis]|uniref:CvpA family protein n=1 Tax=Mycoplasmopsis meleagridis ATCC 25294 TaxID=1264554 RepID=A0A0F5H1Z1_9BACT|nr:CvpA family protein [Mycoplasmopsis meleagridis]KKB26857.1 hypothetical protein MMELEA_05400 [Mycoplasmopsis meleagridis ATCC 25294]KUH47403.1 hypothetical protein ASB56_01700 [Mycoplasmopsis meleagridis]OAD18593.1 hypothetical protein MM26B8_00350 [Mycoplasmopsis meleagridis]VEU77404.1 Colicin V production protein [Mycoplasmopsis meleagridis]